jgi:hypothetical protein
MWNLRLAESVGDGATNAVVVALDMSTLQARRRKKAVSVGISDVGFKVFNSEWIIRMEHRQQS